MQLGDAVATRVVEVHKRKAEPGHRILKERGGRCGRQTMLAVSCGSAATGGTERERIPGVLGAMA